MIRETDRAASSYKGAGSKARFKMTAVTRKRALIALCCLLVTAGVGWRVLSRRAASRDARHSEGQAEVMIIKKGSIRVAVEATGRVVSDQEIEIKCKASGEIIKLPVDISDTVKKGDVLVQLDPENEERSVKRAEVDLAVSQARLAQANMGLLIAERDLATERTRAEAALKSAEARAQEAKAKFERVKQLLEKKMVSSEEMDGAQTVHAQAVADLASARARMEDLKTREVQIESTRQDVTIAEAEVESDKLSMSDAKKRLQDTTVSAPIDGIVADKNVHVGQIIASGINNVGGGTTVMTLADLSRICVLVSVDESDIGRIEVGQRARITADAHPDAFFAGQIVRVATKGTITSSVVTFEVKVEVKGPHQRLLKPEMTANVEIVAVEKENVLVIPVNALERRRSERFTTVQKPDGTMEQRAVRTGASDGEVMEILDGLSEGETILIPQGAAQSRWRRSDGEEANNARRQRMQMRMMSGGRGR